MSELRSDNPETKSSSPEVQQPNPAKVSESDKEKLLPKESDTTKTNRESKQKGDTLDTKNHPKLEANNSEPRNTQELNRQNLDNTGNEHGKLNPGQSVKENPEQRVKEKPSANPGQLESTTPNGDTSENPNTTAGKLENTTPNGDTSENSNASTGKLENTTPNGETSENPNSSTADIEGVYLGESDIEDPSRFWDMHNGSKEDWMDTASHIPEVQSRLDNGEPLQSLLDDDRLGRCAQAYFNPDSSKAIEVDEMPGGGYMFNGDGRHRIIAARSFGYDIPVKVIGRYD